MGRAKKEHGAGVAVFAVVRSTGGRRELLEVCMSEGRAESAMRDFVAFRRDAIRAKCPKTSRKDAVAQAQADHAVVGLIVPVGDVAGMRAAVNRTLGCAFDACDWQAVEKAVRTACRG